MQLTSDVENLILEARTMLHKIQLIKNAEISLHEFTRQGWPQIRGEKFVDGWHIGAVCEHVEALARRQIMRLIINIPPRTTKSTVVSVMLTPWVWLHAAQEAFLYASHTRDLSLEHSVIARRLIQSEWYQERWGHKYSLIGDQNTKSKFINDRAGFRLSTSITSAITGIGGSFLVADDPNNHKDIDSQVKRDRANNWYHGGWSTRKNDPKTTVMLLMQQRFHQEDVSGTIIDSDEDGEYVKLILPMEFEPNRKCFTIPLKSTNGKIWCDPREKDKEPLWPERWGPKEIIKEKKALKTEFNIAGQFQQRPAPEEGGYIKKGWFKWWKEAEYPRFTHVIQSWDTAFSSDKKSSYSACTTWGIFDDQYRVPNLMLMAMWRGHVLYPDLRRIAQKLAMDYRDDGTNEKFVSHHSYRPDLILVESKASGQSLIPDLQRAGITCVGFNPSKYGEKETRVKMVSHYIEGGRVWVPAMAPHFKQLTPFADKFVEECALFPNASSADLVDSMTQVLFRVTSSGAIKNPSDRDDPEPHESRKFIY